ncbi:MAG: ABC transporter permease [Anaerolineales bacterium]|nr:ABC transporter permease [Anaerolineales bacterium]
MFIYWVMFGGAAGGSTSYGVLVLNQDAPVVTEDGALFSGGEDVILGLRGITYENGDSFLRVNEVGSLEEAEQRLRNRNAAVLVIVPEDFSSTLYAWTQGLVDEASDLTFVGDLSNPYYTVAAIVSMSVVDGYVQSITAAPRPINLVEIPLGASKARTEFENYIPGLFVLAVILMLFQVAMTPARDIESGALRRLRLTRMTSFEYLGGLSLWLALVAIVSVLLTYGTALAFGFRSQGPLWLAVLITTITSFSIIGVGLIVACFTKTVTQAFVVANFPFGFFMFLSGAAFPMPRHTLFTFLNQEIALYDFLPPTHAVIAMNKIFTLGAGFGDVLYEVVALLVLTLVYFGLGVILFQCTQMKAE